jgi:hypothetical protein
MRNTADVTGGKPIAVLLQCISGVRSINLLVAFYDIHGGKREVLFFYFVPDTTREYDYVGMTDGIHLPNRNWSNDPLQLEELLASVKPDDLRDPVIELLPDLLHQ